MQFTKYPGGIFNLRNRLCRIVCSAAPESHAEIWVGGVSIPNNVRLILFPVNLNLLVFCGTIYSYT